MAVFIEHRLTQVPSCRASRAVRVPFGTDKSHALPIVRNSQFPANYREASRARNLCRNEPSHEGDLMPINSQDVP
jgi:hypothetical protein